MKIILMCIVLLLAMRENTTAQQLVRYDLYVADTIVNYTGTPQQAIAINGRLPAPTLTFTEGDTAEIYVHNMMHHETSIHWHGLLLPNEQDGVPYLTTAPILPHTTHLYRFPVRQSGTYWYHSHTMLQEQIGMYGAFIIHKRGASIRNEEVVLLSDWSDENPHEIERSLHYATDWYAIQKGATQNYWEALVTGNISVKLENEWKRMHAMDVSDVYYERFLINGMVESGAKHYRKGDSVRLRVINGSASTYFWLTYPGSKITVVATDGVEVEPVEVDRLIIGVSETYDVMVYIPDDSAASVFVATSEDRTGSATLWLGAGTRHSPPPLPRLQYFNGMKMMNEMMTVGGNLRDMGMEMSLQQMDMNAVMYPEMHPSNHEEMSHPPTHEGKLPEEIITLDYSMLKSPVNTTLPPGTMRELRFELTGTMNRYVWTINNATISESDKILIKRGENIRIILVNNSMMRHPMHLHGHYFRVLNGQGEYSPLKNVLDIMPMETDTIEFTAREEYGDWYFHCHILYHMMSGMGRIFTYADSPANPQIPNPEEALKEVYHDDRRYFPSLQLGLESNGVDGAFTLSNTRWIHQAEWRIGFTDTKGYETESHFGLYLDQNQFLSLYTGWDWRYRQSDHSETNLFGQQDTKNGRNVVCVGLQYMMPWFIRTDIRIDHSGNIRLQLSRDDIPLTSRLRLWGSINSDRETRLGVRYILTKYISLSGHYDSDKGYGAGLMLTY